MAEPPRILLADDNPAILEVVSNMLRKECVLVGTLQQGAAVVGETPTIQPDILVLDVSMGDLDGFEITRRLKAKGCSAKIIFLSVHEEFEFIRAAFDAGASGYVFKSRINTDLRAAISAVMAGKAFVPPATGSY